MAQVQIKVIGVTPSAAPSTDVEYKCVFWLVTPANSVIAKPTYVSIDPNVDSVTLAALRAGTLTEQSFSTGQVTATKAQLKTAVQNAYALAQNALNALNPPIAIIGATWDGTTWSL